MFATVFIFFVLGILLRKLPNLPGATPRYLNNLVIYIAMPAVVIRTAPKLQFDVSLAIPVLCYWLPLPFIWLAVNRISNHLRWHSDYRHAAFVLIGCGNTAFFGLPMTKTLLGDDSFPHALAFDQFGSFLGLSLVMASYITSVVNPQANGVAWGKIFKKLFLFPPFVTLLIGILFPVDVWLQSMDSFLSALGYTIVPLTMIAVGMQFQLTLDRDALYPIVSIITAKMIVLPALVFCLVFTMTNDKTVVSAVTLQSAMPPMITAAALLMAAGVRPKFVAAVLSFSTLLTFIEIPLLAWLLNQL